LFSRFFIDRPIFASVLSIVITLAGGIAVFSLPLAQFPPITPPTVSVSCTYPGASARDVSEAVAAPIEQQVNGVENMLYMASQCANDGSYGLTVTFRHGVDLNMAQVMVQNRVALAIPSLPEVIKQTGVITRKRSADILMGLALNSPTGRYDQLYLSNYAVLQVRDELARVVGVGDVFIFGQRDYSMRIWVDPGKLAARNLSASDVVQAIRQENAQVAAGEIGQQPIIRGQTFQITLSTLGRLSEPEQFENIILKSTPDGRIMRLKDVARVELGAKNEDINIRYQGRPTIFLAIFQLPDANALDTHERVLAKMEELKVNFPEGLEYEIAFDTTPYTSESIREVFKTLRDAIILVAIVVLLFLQNWRSALIPLVAVPVAIIGTFAAMAALGFSLNNLTLFGLVLAIGIVVDDAIVVVEAVEHHIDLGLTPRDATIKAMSQVSGPVIAVGLVLSAVFVPCAFIGGITGQFFRQFAVTISVSTLISAFNSLTLSPALTATLLRPHDKSAAPPLPRLAFALLGGWLGWEFLTPRLHWLSDKIPSGPWVVTIAAAISAATVGWIIGGTLNLWLGVAFRGFNAAFKWTTHAYTRAVGKVLRASVVALAVYAGLLGLTYWEVIRTPRGFIPSQDMGYLLISVQLPDSASMERTQAVMKRIEKIAHSIPGIRRVTGITGQSFALSSSGSNFGTMFVGLDDYSKRRDPDRSSDSIYKKLTGRLITEIYDASIVVFPPPPIRGVGRAGGFAMMVEDRGDVGPQVLQREAEHLTQVARGTPGLFPQSLFTAFRANVPQVVIKPDPRECMAKGVNMRDFADTLQIYEGSFYVNDFNRFGRTWEVITQAEASYRNRLDDLAQLKVRNRAGNMVPLGSVADVKEVNGPLVLVRYNMYPAAAVNGAAAPGVSSRQAINIMEALAEKKLPHDMAYEWTDMSFLELLAGNTAMVIFGFAIVMVFLVLAAQYESWSLPLAVILVVPLCLLCAIIGVNVAPRFIQISGDINIFTQIGFVVLVGLASKNAILIVEFAKRQREAGMSPIDAALTACTLRLRPIIMTSFAFILGVLPLLVGRGAGAEMRRTLGNAVFSGMVGVTAFGLFLTPVFFYVIDRLGQSHIFASRFMQFSSNLLLGILSLGPLRRALASAEGVGLPPEPRAPEPENGKTED
jgi:multidrug efflux pump